MTEQEILTVAGTISIAVDIVLLSILFIQAVIKNRKVTK